MVEAGFITDVKGHEAGQDQEVNQTEARGQEGGGAEGKEAEDGLGGKGPKDNEVDVVDSLLQPGELPIPGLAKIYLIGKNLIDCRKSI